jgi:hypothetical protein
MLKNPWLIGSVCVLFFGVGNSVMLPYLSVAGPFWRYREVILGAWFGALGAQGMLHGIWCVFARCNLLPRVTVAIGVAVFWYGTWMLGFAIADRSVIPSLAAYLKIVLTGLLCLPLIAISIQTPLWAMRMWYGWRLTDEVDAAAEGSRPKPSIRHLMLATAVVALALACVRWAMPSGTVVTEEAFLTVMSIVLFAAPFSGITSIPTLVATLRTQRVCRSLAVVFAWYVAMVMTVVVTYSVLDGTWPDLDILLPPSTVLAGLFVFLNGVMLIYRWLGYRLQSGRDKPRAL